MGTGIEVQVGGLALIQIAQGVDGAIVDFGYTQDGAKITTEGHTIAVPGDETGGIEQCPIEIQLIGETARVRLEMTKWVKAVGNILAGRSPTTLHLAGAAITPGSLLFTTGNYFRLIINAPNAPWNFPCATLAEAPIEVNAGTRFARYVTEFKCFRNPSAANGAAIGVLYNTVISAATAG